MLPSLKALSGVAHAQKHGGNRLRLVTSFVAKTANAITNGVSLLRNQLLNKVESESLQGFFERTPEALPEDERGSRVDLRPL